MPEEKREQRWRKKEDLLNSALIEGETILWKGEPSKVDLLAAPHGNMILLRWVICFVIFAFVLWFSLIYNETASVSSIAGFLIVSILALGYICVRPLADVRTIENKIAYCITDMRIIVAQVSISTKIKYIGHTDPTAFGIDMLSTACGNIYIGEKSAKSLQKSRNDTLTFNEGPLERPLVFYNVENPYDVIDHLKRL